MQHVDVLWCTSAVHPLTAPACLALAIIERKPRLVQRSVQQQLRDCCQALVHKCSH